jgi:hypothetical protein
VFRPPRDVTLLCVQVGSGIQITASFFITLFFAALGAPRSALRFRLPPARPAVACCSGAVASVRAAPVAQAISCASVLVLDRRPSLQMTPG